MRLLDWARQHLRRVSHDLDFDRVLALTHVDGPSVIQVRTQDVMPDAIDKVVVSAIRAHSDLLARGALVTVDDSGARARSLPPRRDRD